jgi:UDP-hydrolysing UDP-N-acetyl-D-glucosamine 2-epimerase
MAEPMRLAVVTTSRSDFGLVAPIAVRASADPRFSCRVIACGQHLAAGTPAPEELGTLDVTRLPSPADSISFVHQVSLESALRAQRAEVALVLGDRFELLDVVMVATVAGCVIAHCSGGERTNGAFDNEVRDAVTKMAHLHYPAHALAAERLVGLLESAWRICITGEPGLDSLLVEPRLEAAELERLVGTVPGPGDLVVAMHPVTRRPAETGAMLAAVAVLMEGWAGRVFLSSPNGDPGSGEIAATWRELSSRHSRGSLLPSLGSRAFRSLVARCGALVGNSSAGLVEAPSLQTPSVDVGTRQDGRVCGPSVIRCPEPSPAALLAAIDAAIALKRNGPPSGWVNPYGDGHAVPRILDHLAAQARRADVRAK